MRLKNIFRTYLPALVKSNMLSYFPSLYGHLRFKPSLGVLNITDRCCFKCVMCGQWKKVNVTELSTKDWINVLQQLKEFGINSIALSGGEPFMRGDIADIISYATRLGLETGVITNAYLLNEKNIEDAVRSGVKSFSISIDAVEEKFDRIRGIRGSYNKVLDSCRLLSQYKDKGIYIYLYFTLMKKTLDWYKEVFSLVEELGFPFIVNLFDYTPYFFEGLGSQKDTFWINKDDSSLLKQFQKFIMDKKRTDPMLVYHTYAEIKYFADYFRDSLHKNIPCVVSQQRIGIDSQGNVYGGCWSMGSFGNLKENLLKDIIASQAYKDKHKNMFFKKCPGCSCGYPGNLRHHLPSVLKEGIFRALPFTRKQIGTYGEK